MDEQLASVLIELSKPEVKKRFEADPNKFLKDAGLSEVDKLALASRDRAVLKYQARFGDLSEAQLRNMDFASPDNEHEHVEIGPEHDEGESDDLLEESRTIPEHKKYGPYTRIIDSEEHQASTATANVERKPNSLLIIGTGINLAHLSNEAVSFIASSDRLLYCVADAATELQLQRLNPNHENLYRFYGDGKLRRETYNEMAERILSVLRGGYNVCVAFYGHPGLFVKPAHHAIVQAREEGYESRMIPAISSIDCLAADLGVDFSREGCQIFEATHFLLRNRKADVESGLVLLQIGCVGDFSFNSKGFDGRHFPLLANRLAEFYGGDHQVVLYEASQFSICPPRVDVVRIKNLESARITGITTMYVPPMRKARADPGLNRYFKDNAPSYGMSNI